MNLDEALLPPRVSPSQIRTALTCPRAYARQYVLKQKSSTADADYFVLGRALHEIVQGTATAETVDLRPIDESKRDFRAMLAGMADAVKAKVDTSRITWPETAIRTPTETIKIDGVFLEDDDGWWLFELKSAAEKGFDLDEKISLLDEDAQLSCYLARLKEIAAELLLDEKKFRGVKYTWALKPDKKKDPTYTCHVHEVPAKAAAKAAIVWRNHKGFARMVLDVIRTTFLQRNEIMDVPCNPASCKTLVGKCGYFSDCYPTRRNAAPVSE